MSKKEQEEAYLRQKLDIENQRRICEQEITKSEAQFESKAADTIEQIKDKLVDTSNQLRAGLSNTSTILADEIRRLRQERKRIASESVLAQQKAGTLSQNQRRLQKMKFRCARTYH